MTDTRSSIRKTIAIAQQAWNEREIEKSKALFKAILENPETPSYQKVQALQAQGVEASLDEKFDEAWKRYDQALTEAAKITPEWLSTSVITFLLNHQVLISLIALLSIDDPDQLAEHKRRIRGNFDKLDERNLTPESDSLEQGSLGLSDSLERLRVSKEIFQDTLLFLDLKESKEVDKTRMLVSPEENSPMLHFLVQGLKDDFEFAVKAFEKFLSVDEVSLLENLRKCRKHLFPVMTRACFFNKKPNFNKEGLDVLKNWILQQLPSLNPDLRIRVKIHALCDVTLLGHVFHTGIGSLGLTPSLGRKGRLRDVAESLSKEAKIEVDEETRGLLNRDVKLKDDLIKYFPELSRRLYPALAKRFSAQQDVKSLSPVDKLPVNVSQSLSSINDTGEGHKYITNAAL